MSHFKAHETNLDLVSCHLPEEQRVVLPVDPGHSDPIRDSLTGPHPQLRVLEVGCMYENWGELETYSGSATMPLANKASRLTRKDPPAA